MTLRASPMKRGPQHPLPLMYIAASLIPVLYFYICKGLYFYSHQAGPPNNAARGS